MSRRARLNLIPWRIDIEHGKVRIRLTDCTVIVGAGAISLDARWLRKRNDLLKQSLMRG